MGRYGQVWGEMKRHGEIVPTSAARAPTESYPDVFQRSTDRKVPQRIGGCSSLKRSEVQTAVWRPRLPHHPRS